MSHSPYSATNTRKNIVAFLVGKVPTALLTAGILGLSARTLSATEFGRYVLVMAMLEITMGMSSFGLDWILLRYAPVFRSHGDRRLLTRLLSAVALARVAVLASIGGLLFAFTQTLLAYGWSLPVDLFWPFFTLLLVEGGMRIFRDNALEALALQARLQIVLIAKNLIIVAGLLYLARSGLGDARHLIYTEVLAALLSLCLAFASVALAIRALVPVAAAWTAPTWRKMVHTALMNYASNLVEYLYSPSFLILLVAKVQQPAAIAGLGFVLRLTDIIRNHLPSMLLFSVVRARMIGVYAGNGDYAELKRWAQFLYKASVIMLMPVAGVALVYGDTVLSLVSSGRYASYQWVFAALIFWLALRLHRSILGVVYNAIELMHIWAQASLISLMVLPLIFFCGYQQLGIWFVVVALFGNEIIVNLITVVRMRQRGYAWPVAEMWVLKMIAALAAACLCAFALHATALLAAAGGVVLLGAVYLLMVFVLRVMDDGDRQLINRSVGRQLFRLAA